MSDATQTLIRSALKIGAGILVTKGYTDSSTSEIIIAGFVALFGVIWGLVHRTGEPRMDTDGHGSLQVVGWLLCNMTATLLAMSMLTGCNTTLAPDGAYHGDKVLYSADKTITSAYETLHTFVKWEFENRAALSKWPEIKEAADIVRTNAEGWISSARALRDSYAVAPSADNKLALNNGIDLLQTALAEATKYLDKPLPAEHQGNPKK